MQAQLFPVRVAGGCIDGRAGWEQFWVAAWCRGQRISWRWNHSLTEVDSGWCCSLRMMSRGQCPRPGKDKLPSFRAWSKAKLLGSLRLQVGHEVAVSLLGVEPGSGGRTAMSLCERTGCADLPNGGAYRLQRAVEIRRDCCEAERSRGTVFSRGEFSGINATRMSEELMADVVVKMFCIFRQPLIKTLCM